MEFEALFKRATGNVPFPYQRRLATDVILPKVREAQTSAGKTEAGLLAWLWRRPGAAAAVRQVTPRRVLYCLPMRVLVEQTVEAAKRWLNNLDLQTQVGVYVLMGGEEVEDWDVHPEREAILIGTQDMLLSRAL